MIGESPRAENLTETENNLEQADQRVVNEAVDTVKAKADADPVISSGWMKKSKEYFKSEGKKFLDWEENKNDAKSFAKGTGIGIGLGIVVAFELALGLLKFAKKAIEKKGNVGFSEGYKVAQEAFGGKKDKK